MSGSAAESLTDESQFYVAMHELAREAWKLNLTVDALLILTELVLPDGPQPPEMMTEPES